MAVGMMTGKRVVEQDLNSSVQMYLEHRSICGVCRLVSFGVASLGHTTTTLTTQIYTAEFNVGWRPDGSLARWVLAWLLAPVPRSEYTRGFFAAENRLGIAAS
jgi:hypothetical protein